MSNSSVIFDLSRPEGPRSRSFGLSGSSIAVAFSLLAHAALAVVAARHVRAPTADRTAVSSSLELEAPSFVVAEEANREPLEQPVVALSAPTRTPPASPARATARAATGQEAATPRALVSTPSAREQQAASGEAEPKPSAPRFTMVVAPIAGSASTSGGTQSSSNALAAPTTGAAGAPVQPISAAVDVSARLIAGKAPVYTAAALAAGIEASVQLEIVVSELGGVLSARGLEHVGYGLDEAARQSVLGYRFAPALRGGKPVAVRMQWLVRFQMR